MAKPIRFNVSFSDGTTYVLEQDLTLVQCLISAPAASTTFFTTNSHATAIGDPGEICALQPISVDANTLVPLGIFLRAGTTLYNKGSVNSVLFEI